MKTFGKASRRFTSAICAIALLATSFAYTFGQSATAKRALTHQDYDSWHSIQSPQISRDGKFVAYTFMAQDGDSEVVVRNLVTGAEWRAPRGYRALVYQTRLFQFLDALFCIFVASRKIQMTEVLQRHHARLEQTAQQREIANLQREVCLVNYLHQLISLYHAQL